MTASGFLKIILCLWYSFRITRCYDNRLFLYCWSCFCNLY